MNKACLFIFVVFFFQIISASCGSGDINVNEASFEELKEFTGIGDVKAQAIIDSRPFEIVDDLIDVKGIGEVTLQNMKDEGACVEFEENERDNKENNKNNETKELVTTEKNEEPEIIVKEYETIPLNTKDIKSEENVIFDKERYAFYGLIVFAIFIVFLLLLKYSREKNEFR